VQVGCNRRKQPTESLQRLHCHQKVSVKNCKLPAVENCSCALKRVLPVPQRISNSQLLHRPHHRFRKWRRSHHVRTHPVCKSLSQRRNKHAASMQHTLSNPQHCRNAPNTHTLPKPCMPARTSRHFFHIRHLHLIRSVDNPSQFPKPLRNRIAHGP
jgi:hypothetical protein